jgi:hypothetical protein
MVLSASGVREDPSLPAAIAIIAIIFIITIYRLPYNRIPYFLILVYYTNILCQIPIQTPIWTPCSGNPKAGICSAERRIVPFPPAFRLAGNPACRNWEEDVPGQAGGAVLGGRCRTFATRRRRRGDLVGSMRRMPPGIMEIFLW